MDGKIPSDSERLTILVITGPSSVKQCLSREVGIGSSSHCLLEDEKMRSCISETDAGWKLKSFGGGVGGSSNGSGEAGMVNLARIRSILSVKNSRNALARVSVLGWSGREFVAVRCKIELRVFQSEWGLADDLVTRFEKNMDLALLINLRTNLHWRRKRDRSSETWV